MGTTKNDKQYIHTHAQYLYTHIIYTHETCMIEHNILYMSTIPQLYQQCSI